MKVTPIADIADKMSKNTTVSRDASGNTVQLLRFDLQKKRQEIIKKIESLPPLPAAAQQVLNIVASDPKDIKRLEETINHDMNLTSQLLKVANSAAYYPEAEINTVQRAIVYLGFSQVRNIALSLSISSFVKLNRKNRFFDFQQYWIHSIATAMIARILAIELEWNEPEIYFTAGLLHDIGRAAINACFRDELRDIMKKAADEPDRSLISIEREFNLPHNMIGAWLVKNWGLPSIYVTAVATHHLSLKSKKANRIGAITGLADQISHTIGMGYMTPPAANKYKLAAYIGMHPDDLAALEEQLSHLNEIATVIAGEMVTD